MNPDIPFPSRRVSMIIPPPFMCATCGDPLPDDAPECHPASFGYCNSSCVGWTIVCHNPGEPKRSYLASILKHHCIPYRFAGDALEVPALDAPRVHELFRAPASGAPGGPTIIELEDDAEPFWATT